MFYLIVLLSCFYLFTLPFYPIFTGIFVFFILLQLSYFYRIYFVVSASNERSVLKGLFVFIIIFIDGFNVY
jgi:hypothetical protein